MRDGQVRAGIHIETSGDYVDGAENFVQKQKISMEADWYRAEGISQGANLAGTPDRVYADSESRRHLIAIGLPLDSSTAVSFTPAIYGQGNFDWDGDSPPQIVDLADYPDGVWGSGNVTTTTINRMFVTTSPVGTDNPQELDGVWCFVEGEEEADVGIYDLGRD